MPAVLKYEAKHLINVFSWKGTVFKAVLIRWDWVFIFVCTLVLILTMGYIDNTEIPWKLHGYSTFLTSFCLIFFLKQCYQKYRKNLNLFACTIGRIKEVSAISQAAFKNDPKYAEIIIRLLNAAYYVFYFELAGVPFPKWENVLVRKGMLSNDELNALKEIPTCRYSIILCWSMDAIEQFDIMTANSSKNCAYVISERHSCMLTRVQRLWEHLVQTYANEHYEKIPFAFYHLHSLLIYLHLLSFGYLVSSEIHHSKSYSRCWIIILEFCLTYFVLLGIFHVANELSDPFGGDDGDIHVPVFLNGCLNGTLLLLNDKAVHEKWSGLNNVLQGVQREEHKQSKSHFGIACANLLKKREDKCKLICVTNIIKGHHCPKICQQQQNSNKALMISNINSFRTFALSFKEF